jgi:hypothetical protein
MSSRILRYKSLLPTYHAALRFNVYYNETACSEVINVNFQFMRCGISEASECKTALPVAILTVSATCYLLLYNKDERAKPGNLLTR